RPYLGRYARYQRETFVALNTAFMEDGAVVVVPEGCRLEEPIYLVFASIAREMPIASHPRNLIVLRSGSEAKIVKSYVGLGTELGPTWGAMPDINEKPLWHSTRLSWKTEPLLSFRRVAV